MTLLPVYVCFLCVVSPGKTQTEHCSESDVYREQILKVDDFLHRDVTIESKMRRERKNTVTLQFYVEHDKLYCCISTLCVCVCVCLWGFLLKSEHRRRPDAHTPSGWVCVCVCVCDSRLSHTHTLVLIQPNSISSSSVFTDVCLLFCVLKLHMLSGGWCCLSSQGHRTLTCSVLFHSSQKASWRWQ